MRALWKLEVGCCTGTPSPMAPPDAAENDPNRAAALKCILPQYPGEDVLAHAGQQWLEQAKPRLADAGLLAVAEGHDPPDVECIVDVDLVLLPSLPISHKEYRIRRLRRENSRYTSAARDGSRDATARETRARDGRVGNGVGQILVC